MLLQTNYLGEGSTVRGHSWFLLMMWLVEEALVGEPYAASRGNSLGGGSTGGETICCCVLMLLRRGWICRS